MSIGLKIKTLRKEKNLSVDELAAEIGASRQIIYEYEAGRVIPTPTKIQAISKFLGVDPVELQQIANKAKSAPVDSLSWYQSKIDEVQEEKRRLMDQIDRLTRLLELHLGKLDDCPHALAVSPFTEIWRNEGAVEESVEFEPLLKRA